MILKLIWDGMGFKSHKHLLKTTNQKVYKIVEQVGYSDNKYFTVQFKKYAGMSPKEYRTSG